MIVGILNEIVNPDLEKDILGLHNVIICFNCNNEVSLPDTISDLDIVIIYSSLKITKYTIDRLINCKAIICASVGFDNVDCLYAGHRGIPVYNVPDYGTCDVADHTLALYLSFARRIIPFNNSLHNLKKRGWDHNIGGEFHRITGKTVGIIGLGRIGTAVAFRFRALGCRIIFYDPYISDGYEITYGFERFESLEEVFMISDVISLHTPLTEETYHMIDFSLLAKSKKKPIIINTSRGKVIDNSSIAKALTQGIINAFLADVNETEPPTEDDPILNLLDDDTYSSCIVLTPHAASYAIESRYDMQKKAAQHALSITQGVRPRTCVNSEYLIKQCDLE